MDNNCGYSDNWQPYIGDYDKFEYDIKLKDGRIIENCYPNAGLFNSIAPKYDGQAFAEELVEEIRFSQTPRYCINDGVSNVSQEFPEDYLKSRQENNILNRDKNTRVWEEIIDYMSGRFSITDVYNQIVEKRCNLPVRCREMVIKIYNESNENA